MPQLINERKQDIKRDFGSQLLLHNDPEVDGFLVIDSLMKILGFSKDKAVDKTMEAHYFSVASLGTYPLEMSEFYSEQFCKLGILVTYTK